MKTRVYTSIGIVLVIALAFVLKMLVSSYFFDALIFAMAFMGAYEMSKILSEMGKYNNKYVIMSFPVLFMAINLIGVNFDTVIGYWSLLIDLGVVLLAFLVVFLFCSMRKKSTAKEMKIRHLEGDKPAKFCAKKALHTIYGALYPTFLLMTMVFLNHFEDMNGLYTNVANFEGYFSFIALLFAFLIPSITDTFAYLTGGLIGGKKLAPKISPKKTWSGAIGGLVWCTVVCVCIYLILNAIPFFYQIFNKTGFAFWHVLIISFLSSIVAQAGDLFESFIKRKAGIKDSGKFLPGHGGMLDRCDSYIFVTPLLLVAFSLLAILL